MAFRHVLIAPRERPLDPNRALSGIHRARKLDQHAVAGGLDDAAVVIGDARIEHLFPQNLELRQRARLILAHHPAVTDNIGSQDRRKTPLNALFRHRSLQPRVGSEILCEGRGRVHEGRIMALGLPSNFVRKELLLRGGYV